MSELDEEIVQKQLSLIEKMQWKPKIKTWDEIKETQFFKINKHERTEKRILPL